MTDKKLTDSEIVKEFQLRTLKAEHPGFILCGQIVDLINRQKAEIEKLRYNLEAVLDERADHSEAYKEFAERLKDKHRKIIDYDEAGFGAQIFIVEERVIDNILKELVGDKE